MFDSKIIDSIRDKLTGSRQTIAVAESVTAGFLQAALATAENASAFFNGGITAYNIDQKVKHLGIDRKTGEQCNCVSDTTAREMALGVCRLFNSDWGISITGYATPVPESGFKLFAFFAICNKDHTIECDKIDLNNEEPEEAQLKYVNIILKTFDGVLVPRQTANR
jgi:nicotinamide-nucleotide amidase